MRMFHKSRQLLLFNKADDIYSWERQFWEVEVEEIKVVEEEMEEKEIKVEVEEVKIEMEENE